MLTSYISNARLSFCSQLSQKKENFVQQGPKCRPHVDILCIILGAPQTVMQCQVVPKYTLLNHLLCTAPATVDHVYVQPPSKAYCNSLLQNYTAQGNDRWQPLSTMRLLARYHTRIKHFHSSCSAARQHSHCWKSWSTTNATAPLVYSCSAIRTRSNTLPCPLYRKLHMLMRSVVYKRKATKWAIRSSPVFFAIVHSIYLSQERCLHYHCRTEAYSLGFWKPTAPHNFTVVW